MRPAIVERRCGLAHPTLKLLLEMRSVLLDELLFVLREIFERMDRIGGACRHAGATINTTLRINIHLRYRLEIRLVLLRMDTVGRANFDAKGIFDAIISNYVGHDESVSRESERLRLASEPVYEVLQTACRDPDHTQGAHVWKWEPDFGFTARLTG